MAKQYHEFLMNNIINIEDIPYAKKTMDTIVKEFLPYFEGGDLAPGLMVITHALVYHIKTEKQYHKFLEAMDQLMSAYMKMKLLLSTNTNMPN